MDIQPVFDTQKRPVLIAGPCSAETEKQVLETARALLPLQPDLFRAGIWKPRSRPNSFEGVGRAGLPWLRRVKEETGMRVCTEVAMARHITDVLSHGVDVLWIGARTTVNPFSVQELAHELQGVDVPVLVKNPITPDLQLWIGAIERLYQAGITRIAAVHRGFSHYGQSPYRNIPQWQLPIELKRQFPSLQIICDNSHICGRRDSLLDVAQRAMDLNFQGLMTEVHPTPDDAWSDAAQQITPLQYEQLLKQLVLRNSHSSDALFRGSKAILKEK
jgi:chorismate mutase